MSQAYTSLLQQFHSKQLQPIQQQSLVKYKQLLNQIKNTKNNNKQKIIKYKIQKSKRTNKIWAQNTQLFNSTMFIQKSKDKFQDKNKTMICENSDSTIMQEKKNLINMQTQSLLNQIDTLKQAILLLKQESESTKQQLQLLGRNQIQTQNAYLLSKSNLQQLKLQLKDQQQQNIYNFSIYDKKHEQQKQRLQYINNDNERNASHYHKSLQQVTTQNFSHLVVGGLHSIGSQKTKVKKIYTKSQMEAMLRTIFLILKLGQLNYGNIIQHLIRMTQEHKPITIKQFFVDQMGQQKTIQEVLTVLNNQLLTQSQMKMLSKWKIVQFYKEKGVVVDCGFQVGSLADQTNEIIDKVVQHYAKMTSWFSRIQKRNIQLTESYKQLQQLDDSLQDQINSIQSSAAQKNISLLQQRENQLQGISHKTNCLCRVIFKFNINGSQLLKRLQNLNKIFDKIVKSTNRRTSRRAYLQLEEETTFLKNFNKIMFKSPENIILDWNNVIKTKGSRRFSHMTSCTQLKQNYRENQLFLDKVMQNDLLRIYAKPTLFNHNNSYLLNIQKTFKHVIEQQQEIIEYLAKFLKKMLLFSKNGIQVYQYMQRQKQHTQKIQPVLIEPSIEVVSPVEPQNPFLALLKMSIPKPDKFSSPDEIKQNQQQPCQSNVQSYKQQQHKFCVQSKEYFRRDNFKLIEKLQRIDLKKKGLWVSMPFNVNTSLELEPNQTLNVTLTHDKENMNRVTSSRHVKKREPRFSHQLLSCRHNQLSQKRSIDGIRKKQLRDLLKNISNIAAENQKYRIRKKIGSNQRDLSFSLSKRV